MYFHLEYARQHVIALSISLSLALTISHARSLVLSHLCYHATAIVITPTKKVRRINWWNDGKQRNSESEIHTEITRKSKDHVYIYVLRLTL